MTPLNYDAVHAFIRQWSTDPENPPYDLVGVVHLFAAAIDNLRHHTMQHEMSEISEILDDKQRAFLQCVLASNTIDKSE